METKKAKKHAKRVPLSDLIAFSSPASKGSFTRFVRFLELTNAEEQEMRRYFNLADKRGVDEEGVVSFLENFEFQFQALRKKLPSVVKKKKKVLDKLQMGLSLIDKYKTTIPFISFVLDFDTEGDKTHFEDMWSKVKEGVYLLAKVGTRGAFEMKLFGDESDDRTTWNSAAPNNDKMWNPRAPFVTKEVTIFKTGNGAIQFTAGAAVCVDGAPLAYAPNDGGSDNNRAAGHNKGDVRTYKRDENGKKIPDTFYPDTAWWGVETNADGSPYIKPDGYYLSTTAYNYSNENLKPGVRAQERYVNAEVVPYCVLHASALKEFGLKKGDLAYVYNKLTKLGKWTGLLELRDGPDRIGEVSAAAARAIGAPDNPRGGAQDDDVVYTFYPNTGPNKIFRNDADARNYIAKNGKIIEEANGSISNINRDLRLT